MNDSVDKLLSIVPEKYRPWVLVVAYLMPFAPLVTRGYHALVAGGGVKGVIGGVLFGTNTPQPKPANTPDQTAK